MDYQTRAKHCTNPTSKRCFEIMASKQSNLAVSADVSTTEQLLKLAKQVGPHICVLKTHIDILTDFTAETITQLQAIAREEAFLIFEDRKFADIGNTVRLQYEQGIYRIADWAPITNAHLIPGPGIIEGLKAAGLAKGNGLLLLAQMSSKGSLAKGDYTQATIDAAKAHRDFVIGFIAQQRLDNDPTLLHMTPGVKMEAGTDALGQQYNTPEKAIIENGTDVIIVGRGIYQAGDPAKAAAAYQQAGWQAYQQSL